MSLRIGVDLDGTLADLSTFYRDVEKHFEVPESGRGDVLTDKERLKTARSDSRKHKAVWKALQATPGLWLKLKPIEEGAVRRLYEVSVALNWEIFFVTQRPKSEGASVQRQTQQWLVSQGFEYPSVLTLRGPRGKAAHALDLDFLLDDLTQNCVDVIADSKCRPLLVLRRPDDQAETVARQLNIGIVRSIHDAVTLLSEPPPAPRGTMVGRILKSLRLTH